MDAGYPARLKPKVCALSARARDFTEHGQNTPNKESIGVRCRDSHVNVPYVQQKEKDVADKSHVILRKSPRSHSSGRRMFIRITNQSIMRCLCGLLSMQSVEETPLSKCYGFKLLIRHCNLRTSDERKIRLIRSASVSCSCMIKKHVVFQAYLLFT